MTVNTCSLVMHNILWSGKSIKNSLQTMADIEFTDLLLCREHIDEMVQGRGGGPPSESAADDNQLRRDC